MFNRALLTDTFDDCDSAGNVCGAYLRSEHERMQWQSKLVLCVLLARVIPFYRALINSTEYGSANRCRSSQRTAIVNTRHCLQQKRNCNRRT